MSKPKSSTQPNPSEAEKTLVLDAVTLGDLEQAPKAVEAPSASENSAISVLPPAAVDRIQISMEKTDRQFSQLYAALEWQLLELSKGTLSDAFGNVKQARDDAEVLDRPMVLGVTSALRGEGKTTVAIHLALSIARNSFKKVCLLDLGLGDDDICRRIGAHGEQGVVNVLEGANYTIRTLQVSECGDLSIMPAGKMPANATKAARSPSVGEVIAAARRMFDVIIVDMPAVSTGNALPIATHLDRVLMVVYAGVTPKDVISDALSRLGQDRTMGVILNRIRPAAPKWIQKRFARV